MTKKHSSFIAPNRAERLTICLQCPYVSENKKKCLKCGCNIKVKCTFKLSKCPINRWE